MAIDGKENNTISLVFENDEYLKKGTMAVTARRTKIISLEDQWRRVRPFIINKQKVLYESEANFANLRWKTIAVEGPNVKQVVYYAAQNNTIFMIHSHCTSDICSDIEEATAKVIDSFKTF